MDSSSISFTLSPTGSTLVWMADPKGLQIGHRRLCRNTAGQSGIDTVSTLMTENALIKSAWQGENLVLFESPMARRLTMRVATVKIWMSGADSLNRGKADVGQLRCSDCLPWHIARDEIPRLVDELVWARVLRRAAVVHGASGPVLYYVAAADGTPSGVGSEVWRSLADGTKSRVLAHRRLVGKAFIDGLRVDLEGQQLAYSTYGQLIGAIPAPPSRTEVWVVDLVSRSRRKVAELHYVADMMWTPDGGALYVSGTEKQVVTGDLWRIDM